MTPFREGHVSEVSGSASKKIEGFDPDKRIEVGDSAKGDAGECRAYNPDERIAPSDEKVDAEPAGEVAAAKTQEVSHSEVEESQIVKNKLDGCEREERAQTTLEKECKDNGCELVREAYLRDKDGRIIRDSETGEGRRIDFVEHDGNKVTRSVEVTSETADKRLQTAKEERILQYGQEQGGVFIKDSSTRKLVEFCKGTATEIWRLS